MDVDGAIQGGILDDVVQKSPFQSHDCQENGSDKSQEKTVAKTFLPYGCWKWIFVPKIPVFDYCVVHYVSFLPAFKNNYIFSSPLQK